MCTLLEAIGIVLETYFRFGFPNESSVGDSLNKLYFLFYDFSVIYYDFSKFSQIKKDKRQNHCHHNKTSFTIVKLCSKTALDR